MTYPEAIEFLFTRLPMYQRIGAAAYKNDLLTTEELDRRHGHPHRSFRTIHIAGTNGKGSVSHMLAAVLQQAGYKTGLYTSPHLIDFRERIKVNGMMIPEEEVLAYVEESKDLFEELNPSFFEMTVDLAFLYFRKEGVDIAVIETGMGGRLDSTNIITPEISVVTNIGLDHTRFLGETHREIAREKAGIIKSRIPVVIGETREDTQEVFKKVAESLEAPLYFADQELEVSLSGMDMERNVHFRIRDRVQNRQWQYKTSLKGKYQEKNILTTLKSLEILGERLSTNLFPHVETGLLKISELTGFAGRWQEIAWNPLVICDTAHNAEGIQEVLKQILNTPYKTLHMILGVVSDKNINKMLGLLPKDALYYFTKADIPRALDEKLLKEIAEGMGLPGESYPTPVLALKKALESANPRDLIFIGGSTFVVSEVLRKV